MSNRKSNNFYKNKWYLGKKKSSKSKNSKIFFVHFDKSIVLNNLVKYNQIQLMNLCLPFVHMYITFLF